jgi:hypothetical protein
MAEFLERPGNVLLQIFVVDQLASALLEREFAHKLSSRLGRLEQRRLVRSSRNPNDGCSSLLEVTALGRGRVEAPLPAFGSALQAIGRVLGEQGMVEMQEALGGTGSLRGWRDPAADEHPRDGNCGTGGSERCCAA